MKIRKRKEYVAEKHVLEILKKEEWKRIFFYEKENIIEVVREGNLFVRKV